MFDPKPYLKNLGKDTRNPRWYLQTAHRVLWFRTEHPNGLIETEIVQLDPFPVFKATITTGDGVRLATGYGSAQPKSGAVYAGREVEKAETAAIGRALGLAGYGTQFDGDDDSDNLADSPVERKPAPVATPQPSPAPADAIMTDDQAREFVIYWKKRGDAEFGLDLSYADICKALDVNDVRVFKGTLAEAHAAVAIAATRWQAETDDDALPEAFAEGAAS